MVCYCITEGEVSDIPVTGCLTLSGKESALIDRGIRIGLEYGKVRWCLLVVAVFWILVIIWICLCRANRIDRGLRETEQNEKVLAKYGELSNYATEKLKWYGHWYFSKFDIYTKTQNSDIGIEAHVGNAGGFILNMMRQPDGTGIVYVCMQIDAYSACMPDISLRMRDKVFEVVQLPDGWKDKYVLKLSEERIKELAQRSTGMAVTALSLPPEIKAQLDDKEQRKELLKKLNII